MSDEQTIYISPDDDLTTVRERLESIQTRKVTLVIPAQTQLRSHVAWKLLYARLRELNKEVLIVSSDPQVRSVAHAVKFTVAHSLKSSQQGQVHSRPVGRPTRSGATTRMKGANPTQRSTPARPAPRSTNGLRTKSPEVRSWHGDAAKIGPQGRERERTGYQEPQMHPDDIIDDLDPATFHGPEKKYGQNFDYRVNTASPIQPLTPDQIEEPDLLLEDYTQAQDIRSAANKLPGQLDAISDTPRTAPEVSQHSPQTYSTHLPIDADEEDPFSYMEDKQFSQSGEQHGNTPINDDDHRYEHVIRDVSQAPTSIISEHFEYDTPPTPRNMRKKNQSATDGGTKKRDITHQQPRRSGNIAPTPPPVQSLPPAQRMRPEDLDDDDLLPIEEHPIEDRPRRIQTRDRLNEIRPPRSIRDREPEPVPPARTGPRKQGPYSGQLNRPGVTQQPQQQPGTSHSTGGLRPQQPVAAWRPAQQSTGARQRKAPASVTRQPRTKHNNTPILIITAIAICLIVVIAFGIYLIPTATATITVATRNYSHAISLTANTSGTAGVVPAQQLTQEFSKLGTETATGSKLVGTAKAKGFACFNNNAATNDIDIPTGSIVAATNGVQFVTTADAVIPHQTTCATSPPVPVQAVQPGESGNITAGAITLIPGTSLNTIAKDNDTTVTLLKLSVSNTSDITGGGMQPVTAVTAQDLANAKTDLHKQLQSQIDTWQKGLPKDGVLGPLVTTDTLIGAPQVGSAINSGKTFSAGLQVKATILFVKNTDIENAALTQLDTTIKSDKTFAGDELLKNIPPSVTITKLKQQTTNNTLMKLNFTATAKATGTYDVVKLKNSIAGQSKASAQNLLKTQSSGVQDAKITVGPSFIPWVTWYQNHITIKVIPGTSITNK